MYTYKGVKGGNNIKRISNMYTYKGNQTYTYIGLKGRTPKGTAFGGVWLTDTQDVQVKRIRLGCLIVHRTYK